MLIDVHAQAQASTIYEKSDEKEKITSFNGLFV